MFLHEVSGWPNFFWTENEINELEKKALLELGYLSGRFADIGFDNALASEVETMTNNVVSTFEIEGMKLDTEGVRSSIARKFGYTLQNPVPYNHFIEGIVEMMVEATQDYKNELSEEKLFKWHRLLFPSTVDLTVGEWRTDEMSVVSGTLGRERIHYRAPSAERVADEMKKFIEWYNAAPPSLVKSAIAHFWFVCIHPFDDGNGRIARALSDRVLAAVTGDKRQFYSLNRQILRKKDSYYKVLERVQRADLDITEWLRWFMQTIQEAVRDSGSMLSQILNKATFWRTHYQNNITERQRMVLNRYLDGYDAKLTAKNWQKLTDVSKDTALRDIASLEKQGILKATPGRVRDISYSIIINGEDPIAKFTDLKIVEDKNKKYIMARLGSTKLRDQLLVSDCKRFDDGEISIEDLAFKYFAYALP